MALFFLFAPLSWAIFFCAQQSVFSTGTKTLNACKPERSLSGCHTDTTARAGALPCDLACGAGQSQQGRQYSVGRCWVTIPLDKPSDGRSQPARSSRPWAALALCQLPPMPLQVVKGAFPPRAPRGHCGWSSANQQPTQGGFPAKPPKRCRREWPRANHGPQRRQGAWLGPPLLGPFKWGNFASPPQDPSTPGLAGGAADGTATGCAFSIGRRRPSVTAELPSHRPPPSASHREGGARRFSQARGPAAGRAAGHGGKLPLGARGGEGTGARAGTARERGTHRYAAPLGSWRDSPAESPSRRDQLTVPPPLTWPRAGPGRAGAGLGVTTAASARRQRGAEGRGR